MGRRALIVGINQYDNFDAIAQLHGCVNDAQRVAALLERHADGSPNYHCNVITSDTEQVTRRRLRQALGNLAAGHPDDILFYFSGHGTVTQQGGYLVTQDAEEYDEGIAMDEVINWANAANGREVVVILDCCRSGNIGNPTLMQGGIAQHAVLREKVSVLAASLGNEDSYEVNGGGIFTSLLIDALDGEAADIFGHVTLPAVYSHIEGSLGSWDQRPIYKSHITSVSVLRRDEPRIERVLLRRLTEFFPTPDAPFQMCPDHEYDKVAVTELQKVGQLFKRYRDVGLLRIDEPWTDLYWVAKENGSVRLTRLGRHYWRLVKNNLI